MAQTITLTAGQISDLVEVGPGTRIAVTGSAYIEYAQGNLQDAKNGVLSWQKWPKGTSSGVCDTIRRMTIRATATGSASVLIEEGFRDADTDSGYWQEQTAQLQTDSVGNVIGLGTGAVQSGIAFGPPSTIFRLRMRCSGGAATVTVVATKRSGGSDTYTFSLASGGDVSEPMYADDYSSLVWTKSGSGSVTVEVI